MPRRISFAASILLVFCSLPVCGQVAGVPKAESRRLRLDQEGAGLWVQSGLPDERVTHVTLGGNPAQTLGIAFTLASGSKRDLAARLERKEGESLVFQIVGSDNQKASGRLTIHYGPKNSIKTLAAHGSLHGQRFGIRFEGGEKPPR
ncbi:MAG TPA: hypothetical protein VNY29_15445 [Terriglobales bacterium]|nr:hypothetical protein [Terriglobales bacterium]